MTQAAVVQILDVPQATYAGWETGRSTPGVPLFAGLASFLGVAESDVATLCASPFIVDYAGWPPFGQFVGARRQELRLGRAELAQALDVSQSTVVSWELGYRIRAVGANPHAARASGINVGKTYTVVMMIAGSLLGLAGVNQVLGTVSSGVSLDLDASIGFDAITVALLGRSRPLGNRRGKDFDSQ